jgi:hypothetical protein
MNQIISVFEKIVQSFFIILSDHESLIQKENINSLSFYEIFHNILFYYEEYLSAFLARFIDKWYPLVFS